MVKYIKLVAAMLIFIPCISNADTVSGEVNITRLIADYMPDLIKVRVASDLGACASNQWLERNGKGSDTETKRSNNAVVYSSLLAAMYAGKKVTVYIEDSTCVINNIQFSNN